MRNKVIGVILGIMLIQNIGFVSADDSYGLVKTIEHPEGVSDSSFGCIIRLNDEHLFVGDKDFEVEGIRYAGSVYVFNHDGDPQKTLQSDEPKRDGKYGSLIEVTNDKLVIVEMEYGYVVKGVSKIFVYNDQFEIEDIILTPSIETTEYFGEAIVILQDGYLISEPEASTEFGVYTGQVHVIDQLGELVSTHYSEDPIASSHFGIKMAADDSILVIAEQHGTMEMRNFRRGVVYIYDKEWNHRTTLNAPNPGTVDKFGSELVIGDEYIYIGDQNAAVNGFERAGEVYIYTKTGELYKTISAESPSSGAYFGHSLAFNDGILVVGEPSTGVPVVEEEQEKIKVEAGKVHVFDDSGELLTSFTSSSPENKGYFGDTVAVYGNRFYVGEPGSNSVHIYGIPDDPPWELTTSILLAGALLILVAIFYIWKRRLFREK